MRLNLIVFLSNRCNMGCHYCAVAVNQGAAAYLEPKSLEAAIDRYLASGPERPSVTLLGGEPLLRAEQALGAVDLVRAAEARAGTPVRVSLYTNGTLLDAASLGALRARGVQTWVSLDGRRASNDKHRTFHGREGSVFEEVDARLRALDCSDLSANFVVHADTAAELVGNVEYFRARGFGRINFHPELWEVWTEGQLEVLRAALEAFGRYYRLLVEKTGALPFEVPMACYLLDHEPGAKAGPTWLECENLVLGADGAFHACERDVALPYEAVLGGVLGPASGPIDWGKREAALDEARAFLKRLGSEREWHHACPKGIYRWSKLNGRDPEAQVRAFQAVSRVFGEGLTGAVRGLSDLAPVREAYLERSAVRP